MVDSESQSSETSSIYVGYPRPVLSDSRWSVSQVKKKKYKIVKLRIYVACENFLISNCLHFLCRAQWVPEHEFTGVQNVI